MMENKNHDQFAIIKFIMSILLVICHYNILVSGGGQTTKIFSIIWKIGVMFGGRTPICFFILSGLVAYRSYYAKIRNENWGLQDFIFRRVSRLYPLLLISILFMTIGQWGYYFSKGEWWTDRCNDLEHIIFALSGIGVGTFTNILDTVNGPIWYISILMICYVIFYFVCKSKQHLWGIPILIGLSIQSYDINLPFLTNHCAIGYIGFFVGGCLAILISRTEKKNLIWYAIITLGVYCGIISIFRDKFWNVCGENAYWLAFSFFPAVVIIFDLSCFRKVVSNNFCDYLGRLSFPIYLFHIPTFCMGILIFERCGVGNNFWIFLFVILCEANIWISFEKKIESLFKRVIGKIWKNNRLSES